MHIWNQGNIFLKFFQKIFRQKVGKVKIVTLKELSQDILLQQYQMQLFLKAMSLLRKSIKNLSH